MERKNDFAKFVVLMNTIGALTPQGIPSPEKTELYFRILEDMSLTIIEKRMTEHLRYNKFFPTPCEIRQEADPEIQAQEDCQLIEDLCLQFIFPEFPQAGREAVLMQLRAKGKEDIMYLADRWGAEIANGQNPTATRAQMIWSHKARIQSNLLEGNVPEKLDPHVVKLLDEMMEKK